MSLGFAPARIGGLTFGGDVHTDEIPRLDDDPTRRHAIRQLVETAYLEYFASPVEILPRRR